MLSTLISAIRNGGDVGSALIAVICTLPVILFSLSFHEYAHAWSAHKLGDDTARLSGRMSLNPFSHIHPVGFLMMLTVGFGFAKPVPVNPLRFKNRRKGMAIVSFAGPLSNLILALVFSFIYYAFISLAFDSVSVQTSDFVLKLLAIVELVLYYFVVLNINLAIFNLIPLPPLDGSKILYSFLPLETELRMRRYEQYFMIGLFVLIWIGVLDGPLSYVSRLIMNAFFWIAQNVLFFL